MPSDTGSIDLSFLSTDVRNQIEQARKIVQQAEVLKATLPSVADQSSRTKIEEAIKELLNVAELINVNANTVYTSATSTLTPSSSMFKKLRIKREK